MHCQTNLTNKILIIDYNEYSSCMDIYKKGDNIDSTEWKDCNKDYDVKVDDATEIFYNTEIFFADTYLEKKDSIKLIIRNYGDIMSVYSFPFVYSKFKIINIENDSTLLLEFENKKVRLNPNFNFTDSIIDVKRDSYFTSFTKTKYQIDNIGLIKSESIIDLKGIKIEEVGELLRKLEINEILSRYIGGIDSLSAFLNNNITDSLITKRYVFLRIIIDHLGHVKDVKVIRGFNPVVDDQVIKKIKSSKWISSKHSKDLIFMMPYFF